MALAGTRPGAPTLPALASGRYIRSLAREATNAPLAASSRPPRQALGRNITRDTFQNQSGRSENNRTVMEDAAA